MAAIHPVFQIPYRLDYNNEIRLCTLIQRSVLFWVIKVQSQPSLVVCVLSLLISRLIEKSSPGMSIESIAEILSGIKAIPVKSPLRIVYCNGSAETISLLNRMGIKQPDHILIGALPKLE